MSEDRMGHIVRAQNEVRAKVRDRLREVLREQMREQVREKLRNELAAQTGAAAPQSPGVATPGLGGSTDSAVNPGPNSTDAVPPKPESGAAEPAQEGKKADEKPAGEPAGQSPASPAAQPSPGPPDQAAPAANPAETAQPAPSSESELDQRVEQQLEARLDQEVEAVLVKVPADGLAKRLREVSGEEMEDRLNVSYILATDPGTTHYGYVEDVHLSAEVRGEEGNTVLIKVAINKDDLKPEHIRPGASVTAKVDCGRRAIGYVWFHDLIAFFRKTWFRWF